MVFNDEQNAISYLSRISYFRLKYYWVDMLDANAGHFVDGANFDNVIVRYEFDKKLRNILFGAVEILEVGLRTKFITTLSVGNKYRIVVFGWFSFQQSAVSYKLGVGYEI